MICDPAPSKGNPSLAQESMSPIVWLAVCIEASVRSSSPSGWTLVLRLGVVLPVTTLRSSSVGNSISLRGRSGSLRASVITRVRNMHDELMTGRGWGGTTLPGRDIPKGMAPIRLAPTAVAASAHPRGASVRHGTVKSTTSFSVPHVQPARHATTAPASVEMSANTCSRRNSHVPHRGVTAGSASRRPAAFSSRAISASLGITLQWSLEHGIVSDSRTIPADRRLIQQDLDTTASSAARYSRVAKSDSYILTSTIALFSLLTHLQRHGGSHVTVGSGRTPSISVSSRITGGVAVTPPAIFHGRSILQPPPGRVHLRPSSLLALWPLALPQEIDT